MSMSHSKEFVSAVATIAAKCARYATTWHPTRCVEFAWWSVGEVGDASIDPKDFGNHVRRYESILREYDIDPGEEVA